MKRLVMGSCGFHGSRKAIFTRLLLDDSDESHLMKKEKADLGAASSSSRGIWMVPRGLSQGGALSKAGEQVHFSLRGPAQSYWGCCQYMCTQCRGAQVEEPCSQKCWGGTERQLLRTCLDFLQVSDSTAAIIKLCFSLSYYGLLWHPQ